MSQNKVVEYFEKKDLAGRIHQFESSSATVELAAMKLGCISARIAKTLAFITKEGIVLIVTSEDTKVDNSKFKAKFCTRANMVQRDIVKSAVGHEAGGVCPFEVNEGVKIYLDRSLMRFDTVFTACGSCNNTIELTISELEQHSNYIEWVEVCRIEK